VSVLKAFWVSKNVAFGPIPIRSEYEEIIDHFDVVVSLRKRRIQALFIPTRIFYGKRRS